MALNVNIIGRDSEGNLRALKVNSEGNLEISGFSEWGELLQYISNKLDTLADNSGKLDTLADKLDSLAGKLDSLINILTSVSNTEEGFVRVNIQEPDTQ